MLHYDFAALIIAATLLLLAEVLIDTYFLIASVQFSSNNP